MIKVTWRNDFLVFLLCLILGSFVPGPVVAQEANEMDSGAAEFQRKVETIIYDSTSEQQQRDLKEVIDFQIEGAMAVYRAYAESPCAADILDEIEAAYIQDLKDTIEIVISPAGSGSLKRLKEQLDMVLPIAVDYICEHEDWRQRRDNFEKFLILRSYQGSLLLIELLREQRDLPIHSEEQPDSFHIFFEQTSELLMKQDISSEEPLDSLLDVLVLTHLERQRANAVESEFAMMGSPIVVGYFLSIWETTAPDDEEFESRARAYLKSRIPSFSRYSVNEALFLSYYPLLYLALGIENFPGEFYFSTEPPPETFHWKSPLQSSSVDSWMELYEERSSDPDSADAENEE